jgi:hypothetical protein
MVGTRGELINAQPGLELESKIGHWGAEDPVYIDRFGLGMSLRGSFVARTHAFNSPCLGMLAFHFGIELAYGFEHWWSNSFRISPIGGIRTGFRAFQHVRLELDYMLVPHVMTGSPGKIDVDRLEHRGEARLAIGPIGIGVRATHGLNHTRNNDRTKKATGYDNTLGVMLEYRTTLRGEK